MKHNSNLAPSRKASYEKRILLAFVIGAILLCSCGIRPIRRPDNNISGMDTTYTEETDPPESETNAETKKPIRNPITLAPESYPHEYDPNSMGVGVNPHTTYSYLTDEEYIKQHTIGIYYIQNKATGKCLASEYYVKNNPNSILYSGAIILSDIENAAPLLLLELDDGFYAFISPYGREDLPNKIRVAVSNCAYKPNNGSTSFSHPTLYGLWEQSWIVRSTASGAYTLTTRLMDMYSDTCLGTRIVVRDYYDSEKVEQVSYEQPFMSAPYTPDDDYSDEWIFIPAEPPETTAP